MALCAPCRSVCEGIDRPRSNPLKVLHRELFRDDQSKHGVRRLAGSVACLLACASIVIAQDLIPPSAPSVLPGQTAPRTSSERSRRVLNLNNEVLGVHALSQQAGDRVQTLRERGAGLLRERAAELGALMEEDPRQALSLAFSPELVDDLAAKFPESASFLETHGRWQGTVESWVFDYPGGSSRTVHRMRAGSDTVEMHFAGTEP